MSVLSKDLVYLVLQYLNEEGYQATARKLEQESGSYFYMDHFEYMVITGQWEAAEKYLSSFTKYDDNRYSTKIYFEMRKQHFLETLDRNNRAKALDILMKDLKVFASHDEDLFKEMTQLLTICNIRENEQLSSYQNALSARGIAVAEIKKLIQANPVFRGKLKFPDMEHRRLRNLINQALNWQHSKCSSPRPNPQIKTLFENHLCNLPEGLTSHPAYGPSSLSAVGNSVDPNVVISFLSSEGGGDAANLDSHDDTMMTSNVPNLNVDQVQGQELPFCGPADLPRIVLRTFNLDSSPTSIDFHPIEQSLLLVGTGTGDISLWEVHSGDKIFSTTFKVWDVYMCSLAFKTALMKDPQVSTNRVAWSLDGSLFGVAFSKHLVQVYSYAPHMIKGQLEIDAHAGAVTDIAFSAPAQKLLVITGGEDKLVKVWDATSGDGMHCLIGHDAPIYSVCPHLKDGVHFIFSTSVDGKIKAWLYDDNGARVDYYAPSLGPTTLAYGGENNRLFSSGTDPEGVSLLVEWDETEGNIRRVYKGLAENTTDILRFAMSKNKYIAAGDDCMIKFWDMNHEELLMTTDADGGLPARPQVRFSKDGKLLAVIAVGYTIKILACTGSDVGAALSEALGKLLRNGNVFNSNIESDGAAEDSNERGCDASDSSHCMSLPLSSGVKTGKISRLLYTSAGDSILALASDGVHLMWKWTLDGLNSSGMATTKAPPQFWQPEMGKLLVNQLSQAPLCKVIPCFTLSRNDAYLLSASGGMISLFNVHNFKTVTTFMPTPPAATCLAFYPQDNNVIAIGMDDSTIIVYNVILDEVITKLEGHKGRVTGLAFSTALNVLVSSGQDAQIILWEVEGWKKRRAEPLHNLHQYCPHDWFDTSVEFHRDQKSFLYADSTSLAIFDVKDLRCEAMWSIETVFPELMFSQGSRMIKNAVFSCDGQMVYAGFCDGSVGVLEALTLTLCYRIRQSAYLRHPFSPNVILTAVAAHPRNPTQFAVGLSDGSAYIVEPRTEDKARWGPLPLDEYGSFRTIVEGNTEENQNSHFTVD